MKIKIVTWNIDFKTDKSKLWDYIDNKIDPDILMLQECKTFPDSYQSAGKHIGGTRSWGSVVLSKKYPLQPISVPNHDGWVAGATIKIDDLDLFVFSIHAKLKDIGKYVVPHLKIIFKDIMLSAGKAKSKNIVIGGDFNAARLYDNVYSQPDESSHVKFFEWLETNFNLVSVTGNEEIQTMRGNSKHPYQNDDIYVSNSLGKQLKNPQVLFDEQIDQLSDHNPVVVTLDL